jgi:hypothetical protein
MRRKSWLSILSLGLTSTALFVGCLKDVFVHNGARDTCEWNSVLLTCAIQSDGQPQFQLKARGVNSIRHVLVLSDSAEEPLWAVRLGAFPPLDVATITYGVLPQRQPPYQHTVKQVFPCNGRPRAIAPGEKFFVTICYQYDRAIPPTPCAGSRDFAFQMDAHGSVSALGIVTEHRDLEKMREIMRNLSRPRVDDDT